MTLTGGRPVSEIIIGDVSLAPGEFAVLVKDAAAMRTAYGEALPIAGEWTSGKLSNDGERIVIRDPDGRTIQDFSYNDASSWPQDADGLGRSLEIVDTQGDYGLAASWQASSLIGGTPGGLTLTDIGASDTDGDGLSDEREADLGTNPFEADSDSDGWDDGQEIELGTDPLDSASVFIILSISSDPDRDAIEITWPSIAGRNYVIEASTDLTTGSWESLATVPGDPAQNVSSGSAARADLGNSKYFRVRMLP